MKLVRWSVLVLALLLGLLLSACDAALAGQSGGLGPPLETLPATPLTGSAVTTAPLTSPVATAAAQPTQPGEADAPAAQTTGPAAAQQLTQTDRQGAVTIAVTPLNLDNPGDTLDFDVALNTHSVDLSMDLAGLAQLATDTGTTAQATRWEAPRGGHHVDGKLSFTARVDGGLLLQGARQLTLTIRNVDAPERAFVWELAGRQ
jgi:hypothetical protein